ncbi:hypothetical protein HD553DRAFT_262320, partial [Filobasidium floriforme]|uniref:uncharacterized protein n=1 Tax=Filobasidium floriforme TaxID=5210 RepID=UPI001E8CA733
MSERKVLNKYFPPDFDPSKIPRKKVNKDAQQVVRLMAPFTMCCRTCGEFIYKGKKFNAKKETALGETYYGIKIFRFYIKCTRCSAEITFKTDPQNADYICEHGASRNFEPTNEALSRMPNAAEDDEDNVSEEEDPMKALEESQAASKRQMEEEDALADLRQRNARMERSDRDMEEILKTQHASRDKAAEERRKRELEEEDEEVNKFFYKVKAPGAPAAGPSKGKGKAAGGMGLMGGYGSGSDDDDEADNDDDEGKSAGPVAEPTVTVKRRPMGSSAGEPTVQDLLKAKGIA